jgi:autotransporter translocation and assembly factor TamB
MRARIAIAMLCFSSLASAQGLGEALRVRLESSLQEKLGGKVRIGRLEGDLLRNTTLYDIEIDDIEGQPAIKVRSVALLYQAGALLGKTVDLQGVKIDGVTIHARHLSDGRLNLAALGKTEGAPATPAKPGDSSFKIAVSRIVAEPVQVRYDPPPNRGDPFEFLFRLDGDALISSNGTDIHVTQLRGLTSHPLRAQIDGAAGLHVDASGAASLEKVAIHTLTDGDELNHLVPNGRLIGKWEGDLTASGPLSAIAFALAVRPPSGAISVEGTANSTPSSWSVKINASGIDPHAAWRDAPQGKLTLTATGHGADRGGTIDVSQLQVAASGLHGSAHGTIDLGGSVAGEVTVDAPDLARLQPLGLPAMSGSLAGHAKVNRTGGKLRVDGEAHVSQFASGTTKVKRIDATVRTVDLDGNMRLAAHDVLAGAFHLDTVNLNADGTRTALTLHADASGSDGTSLLLDAHGTPPKKGSKVVDGTLDKLSLAHRGVIWATAKASPVRIDDGVQLKGLALQCEGAALSVDGKIGRGGKLDLTLGAHALDLVSLATLSGADFDPPHTRLDGTLRARGTLETPALDVDLSGDSLAEPRFGLAAIHYLLKATVGAGRMKGDLSTTGGAKIDAKFDLPATAGTHPMHLTLAIDELPLSILGKREGVVGSLRATATVGGTTAHPELDLDLSAPGLRVDGVPWTLSSSLRYRGLTLSGGLELLPEHGGSISASMVLPLDMATWLEPRRHAPKSALLPKLPVEIALVWHQLDLAHLAPNARASGKLEGSLHYTGTFAVPHLGGEFFAQGIAVAGIDHLDLVGRVGYDKKKATLLLRFDREDHGLLEAHGGVDVDLGKLVDGIAWRELPLHLDGTFLGYPLHRFWPALDGALRGNATLRGKTGAPIAKVILDADGARLGNVAFPRCGGAFTLEDGAAHLGFTASDGKKGVIEADADLGKAAPGDRFHLHAEHLPFDIPSASTELLRSLRGTLDGELTLSRGARVGAIQFTDGTVVLTDAAARKVAGADSLPYEHVGFTASVKDNDFELRHLSLAHGGGTLRADAKLTVDGQLQLRGLEASAVAKKLPVLLSPRGVWGAWFDFDLAVRGDLSSEIPSWEIDLKSGAARVPKIDLGREASLQPIGPLEDVRFAGEDAPAPATTATTTSAPVRARVIARLLGPFAIHSTARDGQLGIDLALKGKLDLDLDGKSARINGAIEADGGEATLFSRPFAIERARVVFDGKPVPDPTVDLRITRDVGEATVVVQATGSLRKPKVEWFAEPAQWSREQVERIIVSGDPAGGGDDDADRRAVGDLSSVIGTALKGAVAPHLALFDVLRVNGSVDDANGGEQSGLEIGKYITDHLYFSFVHQFVTLTGTRRANSNQAQLELRFLKRFLIEGMFGDASVGAVDLFWSKRY